MILIAFRPYRLLFTEFFYLHLPMQWSQSSDEMQLVPGRRFKLFILFVITWFLLRGNRADASFFLQFTICSCQLRLWSKDLYKSLVVFAMMISASWFSDSWEYLLLVKFLWIFLDLFVLRLMSLKIFPFVFTVVS